MFVCIGIRKTLETLTTLGCSGTKLLLSSWLLGFQHKERDTQFLLCWLFHLTPPHAAHLVDPTGLASPRSKKSTRFVSVQISTLCFFSKITQYPQPIASGHDVIPIRGPISYLGFLLWHLWLSYPPCVSVNTYAQCVPLTVH